MTSRAMPGILSLVSLRRLLLASLTIAAIFLGLTAMHSMTAGMMGAPSTETMSVGQVHSDHQAELVSTAAGPASIDATTATICAGACEMNCLLVGMVCALTTLIAVVGLLLFSRPTTPLNVAQEVLRVFRLVPYHIALPSTPSLTFLSISRT